MHHEGLKPWEITAVSYSTSSQYWSITGKLTIRARQVTFTNKAAQEMRKRLNMLLGSGIASRLILGEQMTGLQAANVALLCTDVPLSDHPGTFHATCAGYLRKHGRVIGLPNNFAIMDADDA